MNQLKTLVTAAALAVSAGAANAQVSYSGGSFSLISGYDAGAGAEQVDTEAITAGIINPTFLVGPLGVNITVTFLGEEASNLNQLSLGGLTVLNSDAKGTSYGTFFVGSGSAVSGTFTDLTDVESTPFGGSGLGYSSFAILGTGGDLGGFTAGTVGIGGPYDYIIGFNDARSIDSDYDDLVIGIKITPVPEPSTIALLLSGLAAVGFVARRRRNGSV
jgi:PEP-CTERM motif